MGTEWFIGTIRDEPSNERGTVVDLAVEITKEEHRALREAERVIREAEGGVLFRLVFANHRALQDCEARMLELLTQPDRRGFEWLPDQQLSITLALANWLTSYRWLLANTEKRFAHAPEKLARYKETTHQEHDEHFSYRLAYELRDYVAHCDLPPVSVKVESRRVGVDQRTDRLSIQLVPSHLLTTWSGWKHVKRDLMVRTEPIDLVPLADEAMESFERVMTAILIAEAPKYQQAAQLVIAAVDRLPEDAFEGDGAPVVFEAETEEGVTRELSPTPLPIAQAREIMPPPAKARSWSRPCTPRSLRLLVGNSRQPSTVLPKWRPRARTHLEAAVHWGWRPRRVVGEAYPLNLQGSRDEGGGGTAREVRAEPEF
jgi:hypothetical protein